MLFALVRAPGGGCKVETDIRFDNQCARKISDPEFSCSSDDVLLIFCIHFADRFQIRRLGDNQSFKASAVFRRVTLHEVFHALAQALGLGRAFVDVS
jgi:hypothetical protein